MPRFAEAAEEVEEVDETEEIVLEPKHDLVLAASVIEKHFLIEQLGARTQKILIVIFGKKSRAVLDPVMLRQASANGTGDQRFAKRDVPAGNIGAPGGRGGAVTVVNVNHARGF